MSIDNAVNTSKNLVSSLGAGVREPAVSFSRKCASKAETRPYGHPNCLCQRHPGPLDLHPAEKDSRAEDSRKDQVPLLPYRWEETREEPYGVSLRKRHPQLIGHVPWFPAASAARAAGGDQHITNVPVSPRSGTGNGLLRGLCAEQDVFNFNRANPSAGLSGGRAQQWRKQHGNRLREITFVHGLRHKWTAVLQAPVASSNLYRWDFELTRKKHMKRVEKLT